MKHLFIKLLTIPEKDQDHEFFNVALEWSINDSRNELIGQGEGDHRALMDLAGMNGSWDKDFEITLVLPNHWAIATSLMVPGKNAAQVERALPFAVEEFISSEIEELHIAKGKIKSGYPLTCQIIDSVIMSQILALFDASNILPTRMILESELLPHQNSTASLFSDTENVLVKTDHHGIKVGRNNLTKALNSLKHDFENINLLNVELTDLEISELEEPVSFANNVKRYDENWRSLLTNFNSSACIDLLQGAFKLERPRSSTSNELLSLLKVASLAFATMSVFFIVEGVWSQIRTNDYEERAFAAYQLIFPKESLPITTNALLRRVNSKLNRESDEDSGKRFLDTLDAVSKSLPENCSLLTLSYSKESQEIILVALLNSYDALDALQNNLTSHQLSMDTSSAEEQGSSVRARIRVRPAV